jgi:membrane-associated protein
MTDWLLALVPQYGLWLLFSVTFMSCLALPFPASILMMAAGGFAAAGDFLVWQAMLAALAGAVLGDQVGYWAGRSTLGARAAHPPDASKALLVKKAETMMANGGLTAIFLTRWLFSALGPWINLTAGSLKYTWLTFTLAGIAGEVVWSGLYVGLGYNFAGNLDAASDTVVSYLGFIGTGGVALILGYVVINLLRAEHQHPNADTRLTPAKKGKCP